MDMEKKLMDDVAKLDELFPNRAPFQNMVHVLHPEIARYAEMHITPPRINQIPWEEIYNIVKNNESSDTLYKQVQNAIWNFNEEHIMEVIQREQMLSTHPSVHETHE